MLIFLQFSLSFFIPINNWIKVGNDNKKYIVQRGRKGHHLRTNHNVQIAIKVCKVWLKRVDIYYHCIAFHDINRVIHHNNAISVIKGTIAMLTKT